MSKNETVLQATYAGFIKKANPIYNDLITELQANVTDPRNVSKAVDNAFSTVGYEEQITDLMGNTVTASAIGATVNTVISLDPAKSKYYFLFEDFTGTGNLSDRLHDGSAQLAVKDTLRNYFTKKTSADALFRDLQAQGAVSLDKLPQQIKKVQQAFRGIDGSNATLLELKKAQYELLKYTKGMQGANSTSKELKKAYTSISKAIDSGSQKALDKAVSIAVKKKVAYLNKRIATTESSRAYDLAFNRALYEDDTITGYRVILSSGHPIADICNVYAEADLYGMGIGIMPKGEGAMLPFHPNCRCGKQIIRSLKGAKEGKYNPDKAEEYVAKQSDTKQAQIIGVGNTNTGSIKAGLDSKQFKIHKKGDMIPKDLLKGAPKPQPKPIPKPAPPKPPKKKVIPRVPVIPKAPKPKPKPTPKPVDPNVYTSKRTVAGVENYLKTEYGIADVDLSAISNGVGDVKIANEVGKVWHDMKKRGFRNPYRSVISQEHLGGSTYASSSSNRMRLSGRYFGTSYRDYKRGTKGSVDSGWWKDGTPYGLIVHEYAHGLTNYSIDWARPLGVELKKLKTKYIRETNKIKRKYGYQGQEFFRLGANDLLTPAGNLTDKAKGYATTWGYNKAEYKAFLNEYNEVYLSAYGTDKSRIEHRVHEFVAESIQDYILHGDKASKYSKEVYDLVLASEHL